MSLKIAATSTMVSMALALILAFMTLHVACKSQVPDPIIPDDSDRCLDACEHIRDAGCMQGQPTMDGTPCAIWCVETQNAGIPVKPSCWLTIEESELTPPSCPEIDQACFGHE